MLSSTPGWLAGNSDADWNPATHVLSVTGPTTIIADPGSDMPLITASGPSTLLNIAPTSDSLIQLGSLTLTGGASAEIASPDPGNFDPSSSLVVAIGSPGESGSVLSIDSDNGSTLGLEDNHLLVRRGLPNESDFILGLAIQSPSAGSTFNSAAYAQDAMPISGGADQQLSIAGQSLPVGPGDLLLDYQDVGTASQHSAASYAAAGPAVPQGMFGGAVSPDGSSGSGPISGTTPAEVSSVVINGNIPSLFGPQRSMVNSVQYTFSEPVTLGANAFSMAITSGQSGTIPTLSWSAINPTAAAPARNGFSGSAAPAWSAAQLPTVCTTPR